jgi:glycosyltransferase involved in cell wall biosynthesis
MKISIVIPVKNESAIIDGCLDALLKQTRLPDEVIIVDNNSSDDTWYRIQARVGDFQARGSQLVVLSCLHGNQIEARMMGFGTAKHPLIASLDADAVVPDNWLEVAHQLFSARTDLVGAGGPIRYDSGLATLAHRLVFEFYRLFPARYFFYGSNAVFRKTAYQAIGGLQEVRVFMERFGFQEPYDDLYLSYRLKEQGKVVGHRRLWAAALARPSRGGPVAAAGVGRLARQLRESLFYQQYLLARQKRGKLSAK